MSNAHKKTDWIKFREEILEMDGGLCVRCHRGEAQGAILQVHHKEYLPGRQIWEYPSDLCETLCKGCHAEEHGKIPPKTGWEYVGEDDLGDLCGNCDYCNNDIRYVFYVQHPKWGPMGVGTVCCDNLTETDIASTSSGAMQRKAQRLKRFFASPRWKNEGQYIKIKQKKFDIEIHLDNGRFKLHINGIKGKSNFTSLNEAKEKAFYFVDSGEAEKFFKNRAQNPSGSE